MKNHKNLYADASWDVLSKQLFMNYDGRKNAYHLHHTVHEDFDKEVRGSFSVDTDALEELHTSLADTYSVHKELVETHGSVTGRYLDMSCSIKERK